MLLSIRHFPVFIPTRVRLNLKIILESTTNISETKIYNSIINSRFKALYKYVPQNDDELELMEGDTVYVLEKCDDGWFVGSNERTGAFGTFPGNYVDKV